MSENFTQSEPVEEVAIARTPDPYLPAKILAMLFILALIAGVIIGATQAHTSQSSIGIFDTQSTQTADDSWKDPTYQDFSGNPDFQYSQDSTGQCTGGNAGCGIYNIISKYDCTTVNGEMNGEKADGTIVETAKATASDVFGGNSFSMEFDLNSSASTNVRLSSLECIN